MTRRAGFWLPGPSLVGGEIASRVANFAVILVITRALGVDGYGEIAFAFALLEYLLLLGDLGIGQVGLRELARNGGTAERLVRRVTLLRVPTATAAVAVGVAFAYLVPGISSSTRSVAAIAAVGALSMALNSEWALLALSRSGLVGLSRMLASVSFLAWAAAFVAVGGGAEVIAGGRAITLIAAAAVTVILARRFVRGSRGTVPLAVPAMLIAGVQLAASLLLVRVYNTADTLIIGVLRSPHDVGIYRAAYAPIFVVLGLIYLVNTVLAARMSALHAADPDAFRSAATRFVLVGTAAALAPAAVLAGGASVIVPLLFGDGFGDAVPLLRLLALVVALDFCVSAYALALFASGRLRPLVAAPAVAAAANIALCFALIPDFGPAGAALATLASYVVLIVLYASVWARSRDVA